MRALSRIIARHRKIEKARNASIGRRVDVMCQFREVDIDDDGTVKQTGRVSKVYGWRYDVDLVNADGTLGGWLGVDEIEDPRIEIYDANPAQFDILTDDDTHGFLVIGSRGSSKTHLATLWQIKQICRWQHGAIAFMREKRSKLRKYVEQRLLKRIPSRWVPNKKTDIRRATDELAVHTANDMWLWFSTSANVDDARGDDVLAGIIDETQLTPDEARANLLFSVRDAGESTGQILQTLETGTYVDGPFLEYVERCRNDERYRVIEMSVTDNVHLDREYDSVTGCVIPTLAIRGRSLFDERLYEQEIGKWDASAKRFIPTPARVADRVFWAYDPRSHSLAYDPLNASESLRSAYSSIAPGVGDDITSRVTIERWGHESDVAIAVCLSQPLLTAVVARFFRSPAGLPSTVWIIDEVSAVGEDPLQLGIALRDAGYDGATILPDNVARQRTEGGITGLQQIESLGFSIRGPHRNPRAVDCENLINSRLRNAHSEDRLKRTLFVDPVCRGLSEALRSAVRSKSGHMAALDGHKQNFAIALGYLVSFFTPAADVRTLAAASGDDA